MSPRILVIEGPDGVGKSHHVDALATALRARGISARGWHHPAPPAAFGHYERALHFAASRAWIVRTTQCDVLVVDRWWWSTWALAHATEASGGATSHTVALFRLVESEMYADAPQCPAVRLDAPDATLDARLSARGTPTTDLDRAIRAEYRRLPHPVFDASRPREAVEADVLAWALSALGHEVRS